MSNAAIHYIRQRTSSQSMKFVDRVASRSLHDTVLTFAVVLKVVFCLVRQAQFYLGFPVLLLLLRPAVRGLFRRMAVTAVLVIAAVTAYRAVIALQFELPVPVFGPLDDPRMLELMTRTLRSAHLPDNNPLEFFFKKKKG